MKKIILSKEAEKDLDKIIDDFVKEYGFKEDQKEALKDLLIGIFLMQKQREKKRLEWILKHIDDLWKKSKENEKEAEEECSRVDVAYECGYQSALSNVEKIVKKAFKEVLDND